jgi:hypothetical protein
MRFRDEKPAPKIMKPDPQAVEDNLTKVNPALHAFSGEEAGGKGMCFHCGKARLEHKSEVDTKDGVRKVKAVR